MSKFGEALMKLGAATRLKGGGDASQEAHSKHQSAAASRAQRVLHDKDRAKYKEIVDKRTIGEEMGNSLRKQRDKDKVYFGAIDDDNDKQYRRTAIGSKDRGFIDRGTESDSDLDSDDRELLNDPELAKLQRNRLARMKAEFEAKKALKATGHGKYDTLREAEVIEMFSKGVDYAIVHFYHKDFERCKIIDKHMALLSKRYLTCKFAKIDVTAQGAGDGAPFLVAKLRIKTLPTLVCWINGIMVDKIIGFDDFGGKDDFHTVVLENRLVKTGVIPDRHGRRAKKTLRTQDMLDSRVRECGGDAATQAACYERAAHRAAPQRDLWGDDDGLDIN